MTKRDRAIYMAQAELPQPPEPPQVPALTEVKGDLHTPNSKVSRSPEILAPHFISQDIELSPEANGNLQQEKQVSKPKTLMQTLATDGAIFDLMFLSSRRFLNTIR